MPYSALLGKPVEHSVSPELFAALATKCGIGDYTHLKIEVTDSTRLFQSIKELLSNGFIGINITLPYKVQAISCCDTLSNEARRIGAVNAIRFSGGQIIGHNTDGAAALRAIEKYVRSVTNDDRILILGAGGAARAICDALYERCDSIQVMAPELSAAVKLASDLSQSGRKPVDASILDEKLLTDSLVRSTLVVNATPVGMRPNHGQSLISNETWLEVCEYSSIEEKVFFDAIFNPVRTEFLKRASVEGGQVCSGLHMLIYQAIEALNFWTGVRRNIADGEIKRIYEYLESILNGEHYD